MKRLAQNTLLVIASLVVAFVIAEIGLRIHNPFKAVDEKLYGNVRLPSNDVVQRYRVYNRVVPEEIVVQRNSLGFRGPEPPDNFDDHLTIIAIGGSTMASTYLPDGLTWTDRVRGKLSACFDKLWLTNAGFDGHTTFGHLELMRHYITEIRPDVVLYLIGGNDAFWTEPSRHDRSMGTLGKADIVLPFKDENAANRILGVGVEDRYTRFRRFARALAERSETAGVLIEIFRATRRQVKFGGRTYPYRDWQSIPESDAYPPGGEDVISERDRTAIPGYKERVEKLIGVARDAGIQPILMTQPSPFGPVTDPVTGKDMQRVLYGGYRYGLTEIYNVATREIAQQQDVDLIDLSQQVPKNSSLFRDVLHYTLKGEELVARIVYNDLAQVLAANFEGFQSRQCRVESTDPEEHSLILAAGAQ